MGHSVINKNTILKNKRVHDIYYIKITPPISFISVYLANDDTPVDHSFDIFPGEDTFKMLTENYKVLLARSIVSFLPSFKFLKKHVCGHIPHQFQDEMSKETEFVRIY